ncbi:hypothetical protein EVAR_37720_1 [Eumeta japonica]|uniref:Uncharacterized protein n=1 Tax=Eumeta variegata TaxID=151549 RepID=A0A4C1YK91_EUMVA|nr:hypothetical protein EVAR_37720_1 [Eumeta japonica]
MSRLLLTDDGQASVIGDVNARDIPPVLIANVQGTNERASHQRIDGHADPWTFTPPEASPQANEPRQVRENCSAAARAGHARDRGCRRARTTVRISGLSVKRRSDNRRSTVLMMSKNLVTKRSYSMLCQVSTHDATTQLYPILDQPRRGDRLARLYIETVSLCQLQIIRRMADDIVVSAPAPARSARQLRVTTTGVGDPN